MDKSIEATLLRYKVIKGMLKEDPALKEQILEDLGVPNLLDAKEKVLVSCECGEIEDAFIGSDCTCKVSNVDAEGMPKGKPLYLPNAHVFLEIPKW